MVGVVAGRSVIMWLDVLIHTGRVLLQAVFRGTHERDHGLHRGRCGVN